MDFYTTLAAAAGYAGSGGAFQENYRCFPMAMLTSKSQSVLEELDTGGKIILPPSALGKLTRLNISYPMLFEISTNIPGRSGVAASPIPTALSSSASAPAAKSQSASKLTHAGVLEFVAEEGCVYTPHWMMENLGVEAGTIVRIKSATLPTCSYVKLQPQSVDFLDITNPKAVLEKILRRFACLTVGDVFAMHYNSKVYDLLVVDAAPSKKGVCIIECDMQVDFDAPKGYVEPLSKQEQQQLEYDMVQKASLTQSPSGQTVLSLPEEDFAKFKAFSGSGARLDGKLKPASPSSSPRFASPSPQGAKLSQSLPRSAAANGSGAAAAGPSPVPGAAPVVVGIPWKKGKITFVRTAKTSAANGSTAKGLSGSGGDGSTPQQQQQQQQQPAPAFQGKGYTLRGGKPL